MITLYDKATKDFTNAGLAYLHPLKCVVTETVNAEWELELTHPYDVWGKWKKIVPENIIVLKVPVITPPRNKALLAATTHKLYQVNYAGSPVKVRANSLEDSPRIAQCTNGTTVLGGVVINGKLEVITPEGVHGYITETKVEHINTVIQSKSPFVVSPRFREQPFRIYRIVKTLTEIKIYAKHLFYDLMDNLLLSYEPEADSMGKDVAKKILTDCELTHDFVGHSAVETTAKDVVFENINPVEALIGNDGFCEKYKCELCRDWYDVHIFIPRKADIKVPFKYRKNLTSVTCDIDISEVATGIIPTGCDAEGNTIYLTPKVIYAPGMNENSCTRLVHVEVDDATVSDEVSLDTVNKRLRDKATRMFEEGCHLPTITIDVDFINLADMVGYAEPYQSIHLELGDRIRVAVDDIGLNEVMRLTQYQYDCLAERFTTVSIGAIRYSKDGNIIMRE